MKRFLSMLLAVVMVLALAAPAMAETMAARVDSGRIKPITPDDVPAITISTDVQSAMAGETVNMTVSLSGEYAATALTVRVFYDETRLECESVTKGEVLNAVQQAGGTALAESGSANGYVVSSSCMLFVVGESFNTTGVLFTAAFKVKSGAPVGTVTFEPDIDEFTLLEAGETIATPIEHTTSGATVEITEGPALPAITATASKTTVEPGETFTVELSISGEFAASELSFRLNFDRNLFDLGECTPGDVMSQAEKLGFETVEITGKATRVEISIADGTALLSETGVIATIEFTAKEGVEGEYTFDPSNITFDDENTEEIEHTVNSSTVTIAEPVVVTPLVFHAVASKDTVEPGETFTVDLTVTGTYAAHSVTWQLNYDPNLFEAVSFTEGEVITAAREHGGTAMSQINADNIRTVMIMPTEALTANGVVLTGTFKVKDTANGSYTFMPEITNCAYYPVGGGETTLEYTVEGAEVTINGAEPAYSVSFMVEGKLLVKYENVTSIDELPEGAAWYGHEFTGWDMTLEEINAALAEGDVTVNAQYRLLQGAFDVTTIYSSETITKTYTESTWVTVRAKVETEEGQYFQYWTMDDAIVSYSPKATIRVVASCTLKAHYGDEPIETTAIANLIKAAYSASAKTLTFVSYIAPPDGAQIVEAGLYAASGANYTPNDGELTENNADFVKKAQITDPEQPVCYTWIKTRVNEGDTWYIRVFVTYELDGQQYTVYGTMETVVAGTDFPNA